METPCVNICTVDRARRLCSGCGRTLEEIGQWRSMSTGMRRHIMAALPLRLEKLKAERMEPSASASSAPRAD